MLPVGLIDIHPESVFKLAYSYDSLNFQHIAFRYGLPYLYTVFEFGLRNLDSEQVTHSKKLGLGTSIPFEYFSLYLEGLYWRLDPGTFWTTNGHGIIEIRALPRIPIYSGLSLYFGPSLNILGQSIGNYADFTNIIPNSTTWLSFLAGVEWRF